MGVVVFSPTFQSRDALVWVLQHTLRKEEQGVITNSTTSGSSMYIYIYWIHTGGTGLLRIHRQTHNFVCGPFLRQDVYRSRLVVGIDALLLAYLRPRQGYGCA
jgi:hypothetical protein